MWCVRSRVVWHDTNKYRGLVNLVLIHIASWHRVKHVEQQDRLWAAFLKQTIPCDACDTVLLIKLIIFERPMRMGKWWSGLSFVFLRDCYVVPPNPHYKLSQGCFVETYSNRLDFKRKSHLSVVPIKFLICE